LDKTIVLGPRKKYNYLVKNSVSSGQAFCNYRKRKARKPRKNHGILWVAKGKPKTWQA